jgi:hypothetical protein
MIIFICLLSFNRLVYRQISSRNVGFIIISDLSAKRKKFAYNLKNV